jgi:tryptophan synthase alpha chain
MGAERIDKRFAALKSEDRAGFVPFITAGDPNLDVSRELLKALPKAGADVIELGMPFSDPMADGPAVQAASLRALKAGMTLKQTLQMVAEFRQGDGDTPIILMGYFNPILTFGPERFAKAAAEAGVDGLIVVDLPPEEEDELKPFTDGVGLALVRLVAPTTDDPRLKRVIAGTAGFVYFVSITGVTGTRSSTQEEIASHVGRIRKATNLPVAVGFGIKTPEQAGKVAEIADAAVVGSAIVDEIKNGLDESGKPRAGLAERVLGLVESLSAAVRKARGKVAVL